MATKEAIQKALRSAQESRESLVDTFSALDIHCGDITDEMVTTYISEVKWLEQNGQKVIESSDPSLKDLGKSIQNEIRYAHKLDQIHNQQFLRKKVSYEDFLVEFRMLNAALRDGTLEPARGGALPTNAPAKPINKTPIPTPGPQVMANDEDPEDIEEIMRQIAQMEKAEREQMGGGTGKNTGGSGRPDGNNRAVADDRDRREREDRERRDREERDRKDREDRERRDRDKRDKEARDSRDQKDREERDKKDRERKDKEERERKEREDRDRKDRERREKEDRERKEREKREKEEKDRKQRERQEEDRRKKDKAKNDTAKAVSSSLQKTVATKDVSDIIGRGRDGMQNEYNTARLVGASKDSLLAQDQYSRLVVNGLPGLLNQDQFSKLIGGTMPSILNEKGFADLIGSGMEGMLNQDNFAKLIGSTMKDMSSVDNERLIAERQNDELKREIKAREEALLIMNLKLQEEELKEKQLKDKLHSLRVHSGDVKSETDKLRQENEEKKDELKCLHNEVNNLKNGLSDLDSEMDDIKKIEKERLNAHKELKLERNHHKEALQKLEIEIQTCKSSYEGLMKKWQEEIANSTIKTTGSPYVTIEPISLNNYSVPSTTQAHSHQLGIIREPVRNNYIAAPSNVQYGNRVRISDNPMHQPTPSYLPSSSNQFSGSKYASRYFSTDFKKT